MSRSMASGESRVSPKLRRLRISSKVESGSDLDIRLRQPFENVSHGDAPQAAEALGHRKAGRVAVRAAHLVGAGLAAQLQRDLDRLVNARRAAGVAARLQPAKG